MKNCLTSNYKKMFQIIFFLNLRWLGTFNITTASHARQCTVANDWSDNHLIVEDAPFQCEVVGATGQYKIGAVPWAYISNLPDNIMQRLNTLEK